MKKLFIILIASLLSYSPGSMAKDKFRVCADPLNPPYSTKSLDGYENKIATLFAEQLGQELEYYWFPQRIGFIRNTLKSEIEGSTQFKCDVVMGVPLGFDFAKTTRPYFHSSYVMLIAQGRGWDDINELSQFSSLTLQKEEALKIAMFDRGPGTAWLQKNGLLDQGIPYQSMTGDDEKNVAMQINEDLKSGKIDMVILWGPIAGYVLSQNPENSFKQILMPNSPGMDFDFSISMAVRYGDNERKAMLDQLIEKNLAAIHKIIADYKVPLLEIPARKPEREDDD